MCVAVVWDRRQFLCECGCCEASFVLRCVIGSWRLGQERAIKFLQLSPTSSLCRDVVFRRVFQCEVNWSFAELLLGCVGGQSMLCIVARCDGFLIRLRFAVCRVTKCVSHGCERESVVCSILRF